MSDEGKIREVLDKVEEATGGVHKPAPRAGDQQHGNFDQTEGDERTAPK